MKIWHEQGSVTSISHDKAEIQKAEDGSFEVPDHLYELIKFQGFTTVNPTPDAGAAVPATGNPAQWKADVLESEAVRLKIDPKQTRQELVKAVAEARRVEAEQEAAKAEAAAKAERLAELEAKGPEALTPEEAEELAALKAGE